MKTNITQPYKGRWVVSLNDHLAGVVMGDFSYRFHATDGAGHDLGSFDTPEQALDAVMFVANTPPIHISIPAHVKEGVSV